MGRLFWKFFLSILLAQLAATIGVGTVFWLRDQARTQAVGDSPRATGIDSGPSAEFMIDSAAATLKHGGRAALRELVVGTTRHSMFVIDANGREMLGRTVTPALRAQAERMLAHPARLNVVRTLTAPDGERFLVFVRWLDQRGPGAAGPGLRQMAPGGFGPDARPGAPGGQRRPPPNRELLPYITMSGATLASLLFAALLAWYFSRPIRALRGAFEAAAGGDLSPRFAEVKGVRGDELNDLGRDFDRMSGQLRALMDGQRRLLHDVSHELRSPLARLQAAIGLAHQQPDKIGASLERIERESVRMDKLVGELLTLSRLEVPDALPRYEDIAFMELVDDIVADARFEAEQCGRRIALSGQAIVTVRGAPDLLWSALENVIRNAIKHSGEGGVIEIGVSADADRVQLSVCDRGPGVAQADLASIFQPFFRSNATSNNVDGHGLGLAIAQRVVDAHRGAIEASNREGGGLRVEITLPLAG
ncbi:HAMP domain-containing protein [Massilia violaceinigra]|uniref:histidine kinase n=1 Tax=Massilia violaceinigra TaxID=2045208 RepID=A0ABY4A2G3_9BURK|nr:ATP-binding protein [Massilia violaceinigra]UOD28945.1 HAMP domain-containing protein [Massilia violaceinigra]